MGNLNLHELNQKELTQLEGGSICFFAGLVAGVIMGAGTTTGTYLAIKAILK